MSELNIPNATGHVESPRAPRDVWRTFAANFHLFRGTPVRGERGLAARGVARVVTSLLFFCVAPCSGGCPGTHPSDPYLPVSLSRPAAPAERAVDPRSPRFQLQRDREVRPASTLITPPSLALHPLRRLLRRLTTLTATARSPPHRIRDRVRPGCPRRPRTKSTTRSRASSPPPGSRPRRCSTRSTSKRSRRPTSPPTTWSSTAASTCALSDFGRRVAAAAVERCFGFLGDVASFKPRRLTAPLSNPHPAPARAHNTRRSPKSSGSARPSALTTSPTSSTHAGARTSA